MTEHIHFGGSKKKKRRDADTERSVTEHGHFALRGVKRCRHRKESCVTEHIHFGGSKKERKMQTQKGLCLSTFPTLYGE